MKTQLVAAILLAAFATQAMEAANSSLFSSKKEVEEEMGALQVIVANNQSGLIRFLETGEMNAQAKAAFSVLSTQEVNKGKSLERMAIDAIKDLNKKTK